MEDDKIVWYESTEWPEVLKESITGTSIDVLVYDPVADQHTVGWYDFNLFTWHFLSNEDVNPRFVWRYFNDKHDRYKPKKRKTNEYKTK
jgi:hypothetical protein